MFNTAWRPLSENLRQAQRRRPARESTPAARPECASGTTSSSTATVGCPPGTRRRPPRPRRVVRSPPEPIRLGRRDRLLADTPAGPPVAERCGKRGQQVRKWQAQPVAGAPSAPAAPTAKGGDADDTVGVLTPVTANPAAAAPSASSLSGSLEVTPGITVDRVVINRLSDNAMNIVFNRAGTARPVDVGGRRRGEPTTARSGSASPPRRPVERRRDVGRDVLVACRMHRPRSPRGPGDVAPRGPGGGSLWDDRAATVVSDQLSEALGKRVRLQVPRAADVATLANAAQSLVGAAVDRDCRPRAGGAVTRSSRSICLIPMLRRARGPLTAASSSPRQVAAPRPGTTSSYHRSMREPTLRRGA